MNEKEILSKYVDLHGIVCLNGPAYLILALLPSPYNLCMTRVKPDQCEPEDKPSLVTFYQLLLIIGTDSPVTTNFVSESLESDGIRVTLKWTQENVTVSFYSYSVSVSPQVPSLEFPEQTKVQLKVLYDIFYNVSFQAVPFCKQGITIAFVQLYYRE